VPAIKSYVNQLSNKKRAQASGDVENPRGSGSGRRGPRVSYNEKYADALQTCLVENGAGFKPRQAVVWMKDKFPDAVNVADFPSDKQIKSKFSALKRTFRDPPDVV
jgi:hypothetical protein